MTKEIYFVEITDTYAGEANYSWVKRYKVHASSVMGAIRKVSKEKGFQGRLKKTLDCGDMVRYDIRGFAVCAFVTGYVDQAEHFFNVESI